MKVFTVYKHPTKGYAAVKVGFSWPAFFFNAWWILFKGFIFTFISYSVIFLFMDVYYESTINDPFNIYDFLVIVLGLIMWLYPAFKGNDWLAKKLEKKGYLLVKSIPAVSQKAAIALAQNEETQRPIYQHQEAQESYQPSTYKEIKQANKEIKQANKEIKQAKKKAEERKDDLNLLYWIIAAAVIFLLAFYLDEIGAISVF